MHKILFALTLFIALSSPAAEAPAADDGAQPTPGLMHASLAVAQDGAPPAAASTLVAQSPGAGVAKPEGSPDHERTSGMLLAALALMLGIVLRRWGVGER